MDPFLGEIRLFAGSYAPFNWALCNGQLLSIQQYTALFSLLGTTYGGDGRSNFRLPDFQGRAPMHWGTGTGLSPRNLGDYGGTPTVALSTAQLPAHTHAMNEASGGRGGGGGSANRLTPTNNAFAAATKNVYVNPGANPVPMSGSAVGPTGGGQPHNNQQPYLALSFIIALQGNFPPRS
jgi:microcystin-dependent protein